MAVFRVANITISGVSACVPRAVESNWTLPLLSEDDKEKLLSSIGVDEKRIADPATCTSDLCAAAAERLITDLDWDKNEIDALIFVSQSPDYILPATSCILQNRLGLPQECYAVDISLGCSGWVYGLSSLSSIMSAGRLRKGLLLVGDTALKLGSDRDKSYRPLFGDAGTATALEFNEGGGGLLFHTATDGGGKDAIIIPDGGFRNMVSVESLYLEKTADGNLLNRLHCRLDGMDVFSFAITKAPKSIKKVLGAAGREKEEIDYYLLHQANRFLNETIRKKLKLSEAQVPYSIQEFGNTSSATIPLTMVTQIKDDLRNRPLKLVCSGFGVGLSWATVYMETGGIVCSDLVEY